MFDRTAEIKNFALGALIGLGIGDLHHGPTDRALVLGEHLIANKKLNILKLAADYVNYYDEMGSDLGATQALSLGKLAKNGFKSLDDINNATYYTHMWRKGRTAGIGAAHRSVFLAIWHISRQLPQLCNFDWINDMDFKVTFATALAKESRQEAAITHFDPLAGEASAFSNLLVAANVIEPWSSTANLPTRKKRVLKLATEFCELVKINIELIKLLKNPELISYDIHKFGYYFDTIASALEIWSYNEEFKKVLVEGWNINYSNYVGVLTGLWGGALFGKSSISKRYIEDGYKIENLVNLGEKFLNFKTNRTLNRS